MNRWVLVTGAARRIGSAIALELAQQGWDVIVHYHRSADEAATLAEKIITLGRQAVLAELDLAKPDLVAKLIPSLSAELGPITALVNNASLFERDADDPDGTLHRAVNAEAPRALNEALYEQLPPDATGAIVNLLDSMPPEKNLDAYSRSKETLKNDTLAMARRFAPRLRVNAIAPGPVLPSPRQTPEHFQKQIDATLLKKPVSPEDIARATHFLLTTPSITGEILHLDSGRHLLD